MCAGAAIYGDTITITRNSDNHSHSNERTRRDMGSQSLRSLRGRHEEAPGMQDTKGALLQLSQHTHIGNVQIGCCWRQFLATPNTENGQ